jgi:hypothetical protein
LQDAELALQGAMLLISKDFDTITVDDQVDNAEAVQTPGDVTAGASSFSWQRA